MAFTNSTLECLVPNVDGTAIWTYKTEDATTVCDTAGYFPIDRNLKHGDLIIRTTVTNLGASNEAFANQGFHSVSSATDTAVDVNDTLALTAADTD